MDSTPDGARDALLDAVLVPVAGAEDAATTARSLAAHDAGRVTVVHVVEKGEGVPDKTPVEQSEAMAREAFATFRERFPDAEDRVAYARDVVAAVLDVADEVDATSVAFCPRPGGRLRKLLSGDRTLRLVTEAERPVVALPSVEADEPADASGPDR
jgi:nucleotide-binding universal stress UspA family protein